MREVAPYTPWIILMQQLQEYSHHMCYLSVEDLREMLSHIEEMLPSTMHLPISSEDVLHFYRYLCTHILVADEQFLLLTDVPIQDHVHNKWKYMKYSIWIYLTEISQHATTYKTSTWA